MDILTMLISIIGVIMLTVAVAIVLSLVIIGLNILIWDIAYKIKYAIMKRIVRDYWGF